VTHSPFIAVTDPAWFEYLSTRSPDRRVDEVNFWSPSSNRPIKHFTPGEPVFFRLKVPHNAIAGYGFFAHFTLLSLGLAWATFGDKNGDPNELHFLERIGAYRRQSLAQLRTESAPLGCTILREAVFWPRERWIPWGDAQGWSPNIVRGKTEDDAVRASLLLAEIQHDHLTEPEDLADRFELIDADEREVIAAKAKPRIGQGAFRTRLLDAYGRRCAITGEKTEPVLQAAHIQSYLGPRSNHVQNGILLSQEFHTLYDQGFIAITPELRVRVSPQIRERWSNGKRYYAHDGQLIRLPDSQKLRPNEEALAWHLRRKFVA